MKIPKAKFKKENEMLEFYFVPEEILPMLREDQKKNIKKRKKEIKKIKSFMWKFGKE